MKIVQNSFRRIKDFEETTLLEIESQSDVFDSI